jgi:hypothetical protein
MDICTKLHPNQMKDVENKGKILFRSENMPFSAVIFTKLLFVHQHYADRMY